MKKYGIMLLALLACGVGNATQDATLTQREVRDPRQLEVILEANATDAETRIAAAEAGTNVTLADTYMFIGNAANKSIANTPAATRTNLSLVIGVNVQAYDADLDTWATITPSANAQALLLLSYAEMRTNLSLVVGTDVLAPGGDLTGQINSIAVATVTDGAALGVTSLQDADVWGSPGLTVTTNSTSEIEVAIQTKTIAGGNLAERRFIRVYAATTEGGVASASDTASFVLTTGTDVETFLADADYSYVTAVAGTALLTVTSSGASEKWITVIDGSSTTETHLTFTGP